MLQKWPMDPTAPDTQNAIAETYDQMNVTKKPGLARARRDGAEGPRGPHEARELHRNTPWVDANKDNPAAIQNAERLVRGGLRQAAAQHTTNGRAASRRRRRAVTRRSRSTCSPASPNEYKLAGTGWQAT